VHNHKLTMIWFNV